MALDRNGPRSTVGPDAIRAFGDHKGLGLALICEFVSGSLTSLGRRRASADYVVCPSTISGKTRSALALASAIRPGTL